jgi:hypothetical protein
MIYVTRLEFLKTRDEIQGYFYDGDLNFRWDGSGFWQIDRSKLKQKGDVQEAKKCKSESMKEGLEKFFEERRAKTAFSNF